MSVSYAALIVLQSKHCRLILLHILHLELLIEKLFLLSLCQFVLLINL